jgi:hypothetical protein
MKPFHLLLVLLFWGWGFLAAASPHPQGAIGPLPFERSLEPQVRAAAENCGNTERCCGCPVAAAVDLAAAPERRDLSSDAVAEACTDVQPQAFIPVSGVAAIFAAQASTPGPNRPLYLLHLSLRR